MVRAKFECYANEKTSNNGNDGNPIRLRAVYDSNPDSENGQFFKWTPSAEITMHCVNPAASEQFIVGSEYYVDFTPVKGG